MPSPNEIKILRIIKEEKEVNKLLISRRMEITHEYAGYMLNYLAGKGFLKKGPPKEGTYRVGPQYKLTRQGALILLARLHDTEGKYEGILRRTVFLKTLADEKIDEMIDYIHEEFPQKKTSPNYLSVGSAKKKGKSRALVSGSVRVK